MAWHCGWAIAVFKEQNYNNFMAIEICCNSLTELGFFFFFQQLALKKKEAWSYISSASDTITPLQYIITQQMEMYCMYAVWNVQNVLHLTFEE